MRRMSAVLACLLALCAAAPLAAGESPAPGVAAPREETPHPAKSPALIESTSSGTAAPASRATQGATPAALASTSQELAVDYPVAMVNSQKITRSQVLTRIAQLSSRPPFRDAGGPTFDQALQFEIERTLVIQAAERELGSNMTDRLKAMAKAAAERQADPKTFSPKASESEVDQYYKEYLIQTYLQRKVEMEAAVSPAQVKEYYDKHPELYTEGASITVRQILVRQEAHPGDEAKSIADKAAARIAAGEDFGKVAAETSEGPYASAGGLWPPQRRGGLIPEVESAALALKGGEVSAPFKSPLGWHIVKLEASNPGGLQPYAQVQGQIFADLTANLRRALQAQLLGELTRNAFIKKLDRE